MNFIAVVRATLAELAPEDRAAIRNVTLRAKPRPDAEDLARGCVAAQQACYYGVCRELGRQGATELPDDGPAEGEVILFVDNLRPLTPDRVRVALLHELAHALGHDEEEIQAMGLTLEQEAPCCGF